MFAGIAVRRLQPAGRLCEQETTRECRSRNFDGAMDAAESDGGEREFSKLNDSTIPAVAGSIIVSKRAVRRL